MSSSSRSDRSCDLSDFEQQSKVKKKSSKSISGTEDTHSLKEKISRSVIPLSVGAEFDSITALEKSIAAFEKKVCCVFYKRDSSTIEQCRKRGISRSLNANLKYYRLQYRCIHGGKKFKSLTRGIRSSSTFQRECPAMISFICSSDGKKLVLNKMVNDHNHICSKALYDFLPQVRAMTADEKTQVKDLLNLRANKKFVKQKCSKDFDKQILLKDLSNVMLREGSQNNLKNTIEKLQKDFGAECHIFEEHGEMKGLFFATAEMKKSMEAYPEFVGIDGTFKLLNIRAPVYLVVVEDSEGSTEIVAVCILVSEDAPSMTWLLRTFKKVHPSWSSTRCIMADKDLLERRVIKEEFESANVLICSFHSLRTFNREVSCEKMSITPEQRDAAKELFQKLLYSPTESEYMRHYEEVKKLPSAIVNYFNKNWHLIRNEWTLSNNFMQNTFLNTTNNRIESLNAKVKSVVKLYSSLEEFVESFFLLIACLNSERDFKAAFSYQKMLVIPYEKDSAEWLYCHYLTRYAFQFVSKELSAFRRGKLVFTEQDDEHFEFRLGDSTVVASEKSCDCPPFSSMILPCRLLFLYNRSLSLVHLLRKTFVIFLFFLFSHIFVVKEELGCDLYDPSICSRRWTRQYYCETQRVFNNERMDDENTSSATVSSKLPKRYISTENQRFRTVRVITHDLNNLVSEVTGDVFLRRVELLNKIRNAWVENREVQIAPVLAEVLPTIATSSPISSGFRPDLHFDDIFNAALSEDLLIDGIDTNQNVVKPSYDRDEVGGGKNHASISMETIESLSNAMDCNDDACLEEVDTVCSKSNLQVKDIRVPCALRRRGRPKGSLKTIIGLPKKRRVPAATRKLPFVKQSLKERTLFILKWLTDEKTAFSAVHNGMLIQEECIETRPNEVSDAILDEDVNIGSIERYFSGDGWKVAQQILKYKKDNNVVLCAMCTVDLDETVGSTSSNQKIAVRCDYCLLWYHLPCVSLKKPPKTKFWKCTRC